MHATVAQRRMDLPYVVLLAYHCRMYMRDALDRMNTKCSLSFRFIFFPLFDCYRHDAASMPPRVQPHLILSFPFPTTLAPVCAAPAVHTIKELTADEGEA